MTAEEKPQKDSEPAVTEDVRAQFAEALARKNQRHLDQHADASDLERSKAGGPHGPAGTKRTFRRKSG